MTPEQLTALEQRCVEAGSPENGNLISADIGLDLIARVRELEAKFPCGDPKSLADGNGECALCKYKRLYTEEERENERLESKATEQAAEIVRLKADLARVTAKAIDFESELEAIESAAEDHRFD